MTILELLGLLNKTSPALNNKNVLVNVMIPTSPYDDGDSKLMYSCKIIHASVDQDNNIILVCRGNK
jgi:hypothetical protein